MKFIRFFPLISILFFQTLWIGCALKDADDTPRSDIYVQVPIYKQDQYQLGVVKLNTIENFRFLKGSAVQFLTETDVSLNKNQKKKLHGQNPQIQYIRRSDGVFVPTDFISLQLVTLYAAFEKLKTVDEQLGLGGVLKWPRQAAVQAMVLEDKSADTEKNLAMDMKKVTPSSLEDTALFSSELDAYIFVPYTLDGLPLMVNQGVVAHEHFHALFDKLFIEKNQVQLKANKEKTVKAQRVQPGLITGEELMIRAMNEGLADFWSYLIVGDPLFVGRSLESHSAARDLNAKMLENIPSDGDMDLIFMHAEDRNEQLSIAYYYGSQFAKHFKKYMDLLQEDLADSKESDFNKKAQKAIADTISEYALKGSYSPTRMILEIAQKMPKLSEKSCIKWISYLNDPFRSLNCSTYELVDDSEKEKKSNRTESDRKYNPVTETDVKKTISLSLKNKNKEIK